MIERPQAIRSPRIRWRIFSMLVGLAIILYFQQRSVTIAAERIMPELSLSQMQVGWLQWAFVFGYGVLQIPGGIFAQVFGPRRVLGVTILIAVVASASLPIAPSVLAGTFLFIVLLGTQLLLGAAHAPFFPASAGAIGAWLPANRWALAQGVQTLGSQVGAA